MPTSLFSEMDRNSAGLEDQRALQLALELTMLGLNNDNEDSLGGGHTPFDNDTRNKKSQNMTECVPVPSSEHVAEIVGRQGCKIKALRAKTNTYIKTPVRGEEPVFVVTGRKEDVALAKREILSAAEHFSQIRASRKNNMNGSLAPGPPNNIPGQTTIQVRVPYRVVGLVVGPKGATIKRIQHQTHTYIVTPSRDKEPVFEVTGLPENVDTARKEIEAHIAMRTGGLMNPCDDTNDFHTNGIDQTYPGSGGNELVSLYKSNLNGLNSLNSAFSAYCDNSNILNSTNNQDNIFTFPTITNNTKLTDFSISGFSNGFNLYDSVDEGISESPTFDPTVAPPTPSSLWPDFSSRSSSFGTCSTSTNSTGIGSLQRRSSSVSGPPMTPRLSPTLTDLDHPPARRIRSDPLTGITVLPTSSTAISGVTFVSNTVPSTTTSMLNGFSGVGNVKGSSSAAGSTSSSPTDSLGSAERKAKRDCVICFESDVVAALVPCGHNLFCLECANRVCDKSEPECPVCHQPVIQAIRIYS